MRADQFPRFPSVPTSSGTGAAGEAVPGSPSKGGNRWNRPALSGQTSPIAGTDPEPKSAAPRFVIELEALDQPGTDPARRLARVLKFALRACGLRCRSARQLPVETPPKEKP